MSAIPSKWNNLNSELLNNLLHKKPCVCIKLMIFLVIFFFYNIVSVFASCLKMSFLLLSIFHLTLLFLTFVYFSLLSRVRDVIHVVGNQMAICLCKVQGLPLALFPYIVHGRDPTIWSPTIVWDPQQ